MPFITTFLSTPRELKHCTGATADIALVEYPAWPHYQIEAWRPDGIFRLAATDDPQVAEDFYLQASLTF